MKITIRSIETIKPADRDVFVWDGELAGFGLRVKPSGVKSYVIQYRNKHNESRRLTVGRYGVLSPEAARTKAKKLFADIQDGADPVRERKEAREAETVAELAARYIVDYAEQHKKPRGIETDRAIINNHVLPLMGRMKVKDVARTDVQQAMRQVKEGKTAREITAAELPVKRRGRRIIRGGAGIANRFLRLLGKMFACAVEWELRPDNPTRGVRTYKGQPRHRYLDADEIARLHTALDAAERDETESSYAIAAFRVLLYTGLRRGEVFGLFWRDVDMKAGRIRLQDTKSGEGRDVQLPSPALAALASLPAGEPDEFVFKGATEGTVVSPGKPWRRILKAANLDNVVKINGVDEAVNLHCLRHTVGTWGAAAGQSEFQLMQVLGHKTTAATRRYVQTVKEAQRRDSEQIAQAIQAAGNGNGGEIVQLTQKKQ